MDNIKEITGLQNAFSENTDSRITYFLEQANADIRAIQELIKQYNLKQTALEKKVLLNKIVHENQVILNKYPASFIAFSADFSEQIHNKLFKEIQKERIKLGILSTHAENSLPHPS